MNNNKKLFIYLPILFAIVFVAGMFLGVKLIRFTPGSGNLFKDLFSFNLNRYDKFNDVINYIEASYVDSVSKQKLTEDAINDLLQSLDPHSYYISAAEFNDVNDPLMGNFEGIGVEFRIIKDTVVVINTVAGGPSEKRGVRAGDRIVKVDGKPFAGIKITNEKVLKTLKGEKGTDVKLSIYRPGVRNLIDFVVTRDVIPTYSVDIAYMVKGNIGYIKLSKFSKTTPQEFDAALTKLKSGGMKKLILDLRGNGGGFMDAAIYLADEFLSKDKLIVYTEGKHRPKKSSYATDEGDFENGALVILIDEMSASASEIVAGAIQDNDRGTIIGRRSFGKGLVQEQVELLDGSAIRLTVARYHTPTGRCIQKSYKNGIADYDNEFYNRFLDGELLNPDSIHFADSLKFKTPGGKIVYGGGGIMPDVFVPIDSAQNNHFFLLLYNKGIINQFGFDYSDKNRKSLKAVYVNKDSFINSFNVSPAMFDEFISYAEKNGVKKDPHGIKVSGDEIRTELKASIGRNLFGNEGYYPIINKIDNTFLKAVNVLNKK
jgi:carboxyl-terminal processing protease